MPEKKLALVVGVPDAVGPRRDGWRCDPLQGVNRDVPRMEQFLRAKGFQVTRLHPKAKAQEVINEITSASGSMTRGDFFVFYNSSHGGLLKDRNGDEDQDECLLMFDRVLVDDELGVLWPKFSSGVKILTLFDNCHSGTAFRIAQPPEVRQPKTRSATGQRKDIPGFGISVGTRARSATAGTRSAEFRIDANLISLSACKDEELALEHGTGGLFTSAVLRLSDSAKNYTELFQKLGDAVERESRAADPANIQHCQMATFGPLVDTFIQLPPFVSSVTFPI
jgi:hypothetical protein